MERRGRESAVRLKAGCLPILWLVAGCMTAEPNVAPVQRDSQRTEPPKNEEPVLSAVAQFLERTRDLPPEVASKGKPNTPGTSIALKPGKQSPTPAADAPSSTMPSETKNTFANTQVELANHSVASAPAPPVLRRMVVRVPPVEAVEHSESTRESSVNQPLDILSKDREEPLSALIQKLEQKVAGTEDAEAEWQVRLLFLASERDSEAKSISGTASPGTRSILERFVDLAIAVRSAIRRTEPLDAGILDRVDQMREVLADRTEPAIAAMALCKRVVTFGVYEEMPAEEFAAGRVISTIIYSEIRNLRSEATNDGQSRVSLRTRLELLTSEGQSVWEREEPEIIDVCRKRRTDFFLAQKASFPATLLPGDYVLKVFVEDKLSGRGVESSLPVVLKQQVSVAKGG